MLWSYLCDFSDVYIVVKGDITIVEPDNTKRNKSVAFKNNASFINGILKINGEERDNAEDLDVVMPMCNLLEYSKNYRRTAGRLWSYYRDEPSDLLSSNSESFKYKTSIAGNTNNVGAGEAGYYANKVVKNETEVVIPWKHLSNFWKGINVQLINCEIELILTWSKNCVLVDTTVANNPPTGLEFQIADTKLSIPLVTLSKENDAKLLEQLKSGFKKTVKWKKCRSQMTVQSNNNNLNYLMDPTFMKVNRLFVLSFERIEENNAKKDCRYSFHIILYWILK